MFSSFISKALAVTINPNIPGTTQVTAGQGPGAFVANFYSFALLIAGVLALGAIVFGGVKYAASAGNPSAQSDGKEWVLSAIYGIILLAGAYLLLYTVNPALTQLNVPVLQPVNISSPSNNTFPTTQCGSQSCTGLCLSDASGNKYCQTFNTSSTNSDPACANQPKGCTQYHPKSPPPTGCNSNLFDTNCVGPPSNLILFCYNVTNC